MAGWKQKPSITTLQGVSHETFTRKGQLVLICNGHISHSGVGLIGNARKGKFCNFEIATAHQPYSPAN
jgi:hypothetical protein